MRAHAPHAHGAARLCVKKGMIICWVLSISGAHAVGEPARVLVATGTQVPGLGSVGELGIELLGVDDDGRMLIRGQVSDGRYGFYRLDGQQVTPIWVAMDSLKIDPPWGAPTPVAISRNGTIATAAREASGTLAIYVIKDGQGRRVAGAGDAVAPEGDRLCFFVDPGGRLPQLAVNDAGTVAFVAWVGPGCDVFPEDYCDPWGENCLRSAVVVGSGSGLWRFQTSGIFLLLRGVARDGTVVVDQWTSITWKTLRASAPGTEREFDPQDLGLQREWTTPQDDLVAMSDNGELLFVAKRKGEAALYRTKGDQVVWVARDERFFRSFHGERRSPGSFALNDRGDVLVRSRGSGSDLLLLYASGEGNPRIVFDGREASYAGDRVARAVLNNSGEVGLSLMAGEEWHWRSITILRHQNERLERLMTTGAAAPGGGVFAAGGIARDPICLAPGGSVAVTVHTVEGQTGLICAEGTGVQAIASAGSPVPGGGEFDSFWGCEFVASGVIYFMAGVRPSATGTGASGLYRAGPNGIERIAVAGSPASDGSSFTAVLRFAVNRAEQIVVHGATSSGTGLFLDRGRGLEPVVTEKTPGVEDEVRAIHDVAITDNGEVLFRANIGNANRPAVLAYRDGELRVVADPSDVNLPGPPLHGFVGMDASGDFVVLSATSRTVPGRHVYLYDATAGSLRFVVSSGDLLVNGGWIEAALALADGQIGLEILHTDAGGAVVRREAVVLRDGQPHFVPDGDPQSFAVAFNATGHVVFRSDVSPLGAERQEIRVVGPEASESECPRGGAVSDGDGCAIGTVGGNRGIVALLVLFGVLLAIRRRAHGRP
jgi:hypothetical protein